MNTEQIRQNASNGLDAATDAVENATRNLESAFARGREHLHEFQEKAVEASRAACESTDEFVHDKPWQAVGIAAALGLIAGLLISRR